MVRIAPLSGSFMATAIIGFMIAWIYTDSGRLNETWGFTLGFFFTLLLIASLISMTKAPVGKV